MTQANALGQNKPEPYQNMNIGPWFCAKTPSKNMTMGANALGTTGWNHTKSWILGAHYDKKENQYELN